MMNAVGCVELERYAHCWRKNTSAIRERCRLLMHPPPRRLPNSICEFSTASIYACPPLMVKTEAAAEEEAAVMSEEGPRSLPRDPRVCNSRRRYRRARALIPRFAVHHRYIFCCDALLRILLAPFSVITIKMRHRGYQILSVSRVAPLRSCQLGLRAMHWPCS
jgi:hypothetical protein